jgi:pyruvate-ferredoxin/flavodoxin oxidoreductase
MQQQKMAAESGYWPLFRYNPAEAAAGKPPLVIDSKSGKTAFKDYAYRETRYRMLASIDPERAARLLEEAQQDVDDRLRRLEQMAAPAPVGAGTGSRHGS